KMSMFVDYYVGHLVPQEIRASLHAIRPIDDRDLDVFQVGWRVARRIGVAPHDLQLLDVQRGAAATILEYHAVSVPAVSRVDEGPESVEAVGKRIALPAQRSGLLEGNLHALPHTGMILEGQLDRRWSSPASGVSPVRLSGAAWS